MATDFTFNNYDANCRMQACELKNSACLTPYSGSEISIGSAYPFTITVNRDTKAGYQEQVCVECNNHIIVPLPITYNQMIQTSFDVTLNHMCSGSATFLASQFGLSDPNFQLIVQFD
jgi:hypothetical protein